MLSAALQTKILDTNLAYYGISTLFLMENAGKGIAEEMEKRFGKNKKIWVFAGLGNNGGDALVAARYLCKNNFVKVFLAGKENEIKTKEAAENFLKIKKIKSIQKKFISTISKIPTSIDAEIALLGLFGIGLQGEIREPHKSILEKIAVSKAKKIAIDVSPPNFKTDLTISLHMAKEKNAKVIPIGIPKEKEFLCGPGDVKFLKKRERGSHKGDNGIVAIIAGSRQYHGAAVFSGITVSRLVDLVYFLTAKENIPFVKKASPEFIVSEFAWENAKKFVEKSDSILIGPGLERSKSNAKIVEKILSKFKGKKIVLDAGALHILNPKKLNSNCILTPHSNEFKSLFGVSVSEKNVKLMAKKFNCIIVLKGKIDLISNGKTVWKCIGGNAMLTGGGTGDVLAGMIAGFSAKNDLLQSARAACFLNKFTAELLSKEKDEMWNAEDLMNKLPDAKKKIEEM